MDRKALRRELRASRDALEPDLRREWSASACRNLLNMEEFRNSRSVFVFVSFGSEISTAPVLDAATASGSDVYVPVVQGRVMRGALLGPEHHPGDHAPPSWSLNRYGIPEPAGSRAFIETADQADLILVPGLAFDRQGYRIGYGGGFYDRFLADREKTLAVGLCFATQILPSVPREDHDMPVDAVITEEGIIRVKNE